MGDVLTMVMRSTRRPMLIIANVIKVKGPPYFCCFKSLVKSPAFVSQLKPPLCYYIKSESINFFNATIYLNWRARTQNPTMKNSSALLKDLRPGWAQLRSSYFVQNHSHVSICSITHVLNSRGLSVKIDYTNSY